jgi:hypothetical protein
MISPRKLVNQAAPALGATAVEGDHRFRFMSGAHVAFMTGQEGKNPELKLEVQSLPDPFEQERWLPLDVPEPPLIEFVREGKLARVGKLLLINKEYQSGDPEFDALVYIHSNGVPDAYIKHVLQQPGARDAISALLRAGYGSVTIDAQARGGVAHATRTDGAGDADTLRTQAAHLARLVDAIPPCTPAHVGRKMDLGSKLLIGSILTAFASIFFVAALQHMWPIHGPRWSEPWWIAATTWLGAVLLLIPILRGDSRAFNFLLVISVALAICIPCLMLPTLRAVNALADTSEPQVVQASILELTSSRGSKSTTYHVKLDLHDGVKPERRGISYLDYQRLQGDGPAQVTLGQGALGWPWIARFSRP